MPPEKITSADDPRIAPFTSLTEVQLRSRLDPAAALFICESPKVIRVALSQGLQPVSLLCEEKHIDGDARDIIAQNPAMPVYTGERQLLAQITGYTLTRGVLCAMRRPAEPQADDLLKDAHRVCVLHGITDTTNIGAIFRAAAALGIDCVMLSSDTCDPLNRRSVRTSMGSVFLVPWAFADHPLDLLHAHGFKTAALALTDRSRPIDDAAACAEERLALVLGTEGDGLPPDVIAQCSYTLRIPMHHAVDSLNVACAASVAFYATQRR